MLQHPRGLWIRAFRSIDRARCLPPEEVRAGHASVLLAPFDVAFAASLVPQLLQVTRQASGALAGPGSMTSSMLHLRQENASPAMRLTCCLLMRSSCKQCQAASRSANIGQWQ
jgi:hypothetical protein